MRKATIEILITILLWISIIISIIRNPHFGPQFIFGTIAVISVSAALLLKKRDLSLGILTFALFLSIFNVVKFSEAFGLSIGFISLIPFLLLLILIFSRFAELITLKEKWFGVEPTEVAKAQESRITLYKQKFQTLSSEELMRRRNNDKLVEEAKTAIDQILKER